MSDELKTPSEWCAVTGIVILDPDGWDRKLQDSSPGSFWAPCSEEEFMRRAFMSTVANWPV